jgi:hypothetical protein
MPLLPVPGVKQKAALRGCLDAMEDGEVVPSRLVDPGQVVSDTARWIEMVPASPVCLCLTPSAILLQPRPGMGDRVGAGAEERGPAGKSSPALGCWPSSPLAPCPPALPQPSRQGHRRLTPQRLCARAIADSKIEILLLVNMPSLSVRLGKNYGKRSTAEHESADQGRVDKPNNLT